MMKDFFAAIDNGYTCLQPATVPSAASGAIVAKRRPSRQAMAVSVFVLFLFCLADLLQAQNTVSQTAAHHNSNEPENALSHHLDSELGFTYDVPSDLLIVDTKKLGSPSQLAANRGLSLSSGEKNSIVCGRELLMAMAHDNTRIINFSFHSQDCFGVALEAKHFSQIGSSVISELNRQFALANIETASSTVKSHSVWVMRSTIMPANSKNPNRYMAVSIMPVKQGMVEVLVQAKSKDDLNSLMATQIHFDDGNESEIVPTKLFSSK